MHNEQIRLESRYADYWKNRDFSQVNSIKASGLIVQGLNDENVVTKHMDLMYKAFKHSNAEARLLLHQNAHITPTDADNEWEILIDGKSYDEILNGWFSHYLCDVDNGAGSRAEVTVQSNVDGKFYTYDSWTADGKLTLQPESDDETVVNADGAYAGNDNLLEHTFTGESSKNAALWSETVQEDTTIEGTVRVHLKTKFTNIDTQNPHLSAVLVDRADEPFGIFQTDSSLSPTQLPLSVIEKDGAARGEGLDPFDLVEFKQTQATKKIIALGAVNPRRPDAGYEAKTALNPESPVEDGEYHDYDIYLRPNLYTVKAGHHLELYVVPYCNMYDAGAASNAETPGDDLVAIDELSMQGNSAASNSLIPHGKDYTFTIDNASSYDEVPIMKISDPEPDPEPAPSPTPSDDPSDTDPSAADVGPEAEGNTAEQPTSETGDQFPVGMTIAFAACALAAAAGFIVIRRLRKR